MDGRHGLSQPGRPNSLKKPIDELRKNAHGKFVEKGMKDTDVLVIDEILMVEAHFIERLNIVLEEARGSNAPFGGMQLMVTGDFCQLPLVKPFKYCMQCGRETMPKLAGTVYKCPKHGEFRESDKWAFRSAAWEECRFTHVNLTQIHRQKDEVFINILQKL